MVDWYHHYLVWLAKTAKARWPKTNLWGRSTSGHSIPKSQPLPSFFPDWYDAKRVALVLGPFSANLEEIVNDRKWSRLNLHQKSLKLAMQQERHKCFTISNRLRPSRRWWRTCRSCRASVPRPFVGQSPPWCSRHRSSLRQAAQPLPWNINSKKLLAKRRMSDFPNRLTKIQPNASWIDNSCLGMADKVWKNIFHALGLKDICLKVAQSQQQQKW